MPSRAVDSAGRAETSGARTQIGGPGHWPSGLTPKLVPLLSTSTSCSQVVPCDRRKLLSAPRQGLEWDISTARSETYPRRLAFRLPEACRCRGSALTIEASPAPAFLRQSARSGPTKTPITSRSATKPMRRKAAWAQCPGGFSHVGTPGGLGWAPYTEYSPSVPRTQPSNGFYGFPALSQQLRVEREVPHWLPTARHSYAVSRERPALGLFRPDLKVPGPNRRNRGVGRELVFLIKAQLRCHAGTGGAYPRQLNHTNIERG